MRSPVAALRGRLARLIAPKPDRGAGHRRGHYEAARFTRYVDFYNALEAAHKERCRDLTSLRAHSRDLAKNNAYMQAYVDLIADNMIGPDGIDLENDLKDRDGRALEKENDIVEAAWADWGRRVTADGRLGWLDFQHLAAKSLAIDGEIFVHLLRGHGPHGLLLELIDPDRVDHRINTPLQDGRRITMGVETDAAFRPTAYHVRTAHPNDPQGMPVLTRVPAGEIIHVFADDRANAVRGIPWATSCMVQLNMLGRLWTSTLATANAEADRIGIIKGASGLPIDDMERLSAAGEEAGLTTVDVAENLTTDMLSFMGVPPGMDVDFPAPTHPNPVLADFTKFLLKGIASAMRVSYHALSGDVAEANYSSLRASLLPEKDAWRSKQNSFISKLNDPIYRAWAEMSWLSGRLALRMAPVEFVRPIWWPRSWEWIDPQKDISADVAALDNTLATYQEILGKRGRDWRETFRQRKAEEDYAAEIGLALSAKTKLAMLSAPPPAALAPGEAGTDQAGGAGAEAPAPTEEGLRPTEVAIQDTALNGAQVTGLLSLLASAGDGSLPKAAVKAAVKAAFPMLGDGQVDAMVDPIEIKGPPPPAPEPETERPPDAGAHEGQGDGGDRGPVGTAPWPERTAVSGGQAPQGGLGEGAREGGGPSGSAPPEKHRRVAGPRPEDESPNQQETQ